MGSGSGVADTDALTQYTSAAYAAVAEELGGVRLSVGRSGSFHDNAVADSWSEWVHPDQPAGALVRPYLLRE